MIYDYQNSAPGCQVIDMDSGKPIESVFETYTSAGILRVADKPLRVDRERGEVASHLIRFRSIYPIQGSEPKPVLFHCYGRLSS